MNPNLGGNLNGSTSGSDLPSGIITEKSPGLRVLFVGYGRAGKDEAAQFCEAHLGLRYGGSFSWHAKEDVAAFLGVHPMTAWETRHKNRQVWYEQCNAIRARNITELAERALRSGDICAGLRDKPELDAAAAKGLFDRIVWIENPRVPKDFTVTFTREDVLALPNGSEIVNDGSLELYHKRVALFFHRNVLTWSGAPNRKLQLKPSEYAKGLFS